MTIFSERDIDLHILLLDEPTNNLDTVGIWHMTEFLKNYPKTVLVISHDAEFLNAFTDGILYLDVWTKKVEQFMGNYDDAVEQVERSIEAQNRANSRLEKEIQAQRLIKILLNVLRNLFPLYQNSILTRLVKDIENSF